MILIWKVFSVLHRSVICVQCLFYCGLGLYRIILQGEDFSSDCDLYILVIKIVHCTGPRIFAGMFFLPHSKALEKRCMMITSERISAILFLDSKKVHLLWEQSLMMY